VFGARFSGAGFGGTCIAIADPEACREIIDRVSAGFSARHPDLADEAFFTVCRTAGSVRWIDRGP
jgi:galactokinase